MERVSNAPFKVSQTAQSKNLECRNCGLRCYPVVLADLGYCMKCGSTQFKVSKPEEGIFPVSSLEANY